MKTIRGLLGITILGTILFLPVFAIDTPNDFAIIPEAVDSTNVEKVVETIGAKGGHVWDAYNSGAKSLEGKVGDQIASGVMTRNTLLDYVVYIVRFLSQIGLVIGGVMIIYAGYLYAMTVFGGGDASKGNKAILNAIIGIIVIAFSYAIMKLLTSAFIS